MVASTVIVLTTCAICRDEDAGTDMVVTKCGHAFHSACMKQWEKAQIDQGRINIKCPYCNVPFNNPHGYYDNYSISSTTQRHTRLHSLTLRRVLILEDGKPSPEEELQKTRANLDVTKALLIKESSKVSQLEMDLSKLQLTVAKLKTESKQQVDKIDSLGLELKAEKQQRQKAIAQHLGEKSRLQRRIDDASAFIDKLKAERQEGNNHLFELRRDNTNIRRLKDQQGQEIKRLQLQIGTLTRAKTSLDLKISGINRSQRLLSNQYQHSSHIPPDVLQDLKEGYQRWEVACLTLKDLFTRKLESFNSDVPSTQSVDGIPINPVLLQPMESGLMSCQIRREDINPVNPISNKPFEGSGDRKKFVKNKGKQKAAIDNSTNNDKSAFKGNKKLAGKKMKNVAEISTASNQNQLELDGLKTNEDSITIPSNLANENPLKQQDPIILESNPQNNGNAHDPHEVEFNLFLEERSRYEPSTQEIKVIESLD